MLGQSLMGLNQDLLCLKDNPTMFPWKYKKRCSKVRQLRILPTNCFWLYHNNLAGIGQTNCFQFKSLISSLIHSIFISEILVFEGSYITLAFSVAMFTNIATPSIAAIALSTDLAQDGHPAMEGVFACCF